MWKRDRSLCCCFAEALIWINPGRALRIVYYPDELQRIRDACRRSASAPRGDPGGCAAAWLCQRLSRHLHLDYTRRSRQRADGEPRIPAGACYRAQWQQAFHFVPPLFAFGVGVVVTV
jgi:hypothetical protein